MILWGRAFRLISRLGFIDPASGIRPDHGQGNKSVSEHQACPVTCMRGDALSNQPKHMIIQVIYRR